MRRIAGGDDQSLRAYKGFYRSSHQELAVGVCVKMPRISDAEKKVVAKIIKQLEEILDVLDQGKFDIPATHIAAAIELLQKEANRDREGGACSE